MYVKPDHMFGLQIKNNMANAWTQYKEGMEVRYSNFISGRNERITVRSIDQANLGSF